MVMVGGMVYKIQTPPPALPNVLGWISLAASLLINVNSSYILPILAFNFAVWKYRLPAAAARLQQDPSWLQNRILDIASCCLVSCKRAKPISIDYDTDASVLSHDTLVCDTKYDAVCYTDGSASPNPGPSGAGVSIFIKSPPLLVDAGHPTGHASNNVAELYALWVCFTELSRLCTPHAINNALVFCDSMYALRWVTSPKSPTINSKLIAAMRSAYVEAARHVSISLQWIRGHAHVGGNERVDSIAKNFARFNSKPPTSIIFDQPLTYFARHTDWPFGLVNVPVTSFTLNVPACSSFTPTAAPLKRKRRRPI
jgi:ribonuclease HI